MEKRYTILAVRDGIGTVGVPFYEIERAEALRLFFLDIIEELQKGESGASTMVLSEESETIATVWLRHSQVRKGGYAKTEENTTN